MPSADFDVAQLKPFPLNEAKSPDPAACPAASGITPAAASAPPALAYRVRPG